MALTHTAGRATRRRLVWLGGLTALFGMTRSADRAEAANGQSVILGQANSSTLTTTMQMNSPRGVYGPDGTLHAALNTTPSRVDFTGAVVGQAAGENGRLTAGVVAVATGQNNFGLAAYSTHHTGIFANGKAGVSGHGEIALHGLGSVTGVRGKVSKSSTTGTGVLGESHVGDGVVGRGTRAGCAGYGTTGANGTQGYGVYGASPQGPTPSIRIGWAGVFDGDVQVRDGTFTVVRGVKSAAVPHPDGSHRRLYCQESPEPWFEDFGQAALVGGKATVTLDKDFAAVVKTDTYHVFLTEYGASSGVYVAGRTPTAFEVRAANATSASTFSYRVVARRKDVEGPRLEKVEIPAPIPFVAPPEIPDPEPAKAG